MTSVFVRDRLPHLAYDLDVGTRSPRDLVVFCHGFASVRGGEKATMIRARARERGWSYLAFDARAHGASGGAMRDFTFTGYREDLAAMLDGPGRAFDRVLLLGSSLGGAAALHHAADRPERLVGCVAIAPGLGFAQRVFDAIDDAERARWKRSGVRKVKNEWIEFELGVGFLEDGFAVDDDAMAARLRTPTLLIHGTRDEVVPFAVSTEFLGKTRGIDVSLEPIDGGDHRLSAAKEQVLSLVEAFADRRFAAPPS